MVVQPLLALLLCGAPQAKPNSTAGVSADEVRRVVAFVVQTAERDRARRPPRTGDALADHYIRRAARFTLKEGISPRAYLVALGVALDGSNQLRSNPLVSWYLARLESDGERRHRLRVLGKPTMLGRDDWLQHFVVSAALTAQVGPAMAEQAGIMKELSDARGRSGFSFADLAADNAGICFARTLLDPGRDAGHALTAVVLNFEGKLHLPEMNDLEDGLPYADLVRKYGEPTDTGFQRACRDVRRRVENLPAFRTLSKEPRSPGQQ